MRHRPGLVLVTLAGLLAGSAAAAQSGRQPRVEPRANPSAVVAAEIALSREARERGQWAALRSQAAPGAVLHNADGPVPADAWLAGQGANPQPARRSTRTVWSSCDGTLAISQGRTRGADGVVGSFVTVWQREGRKGYRWLYTASAPDDPQPPPPPAPLPADAEAEDLILVTGLDMVDGRVADCRADGRPPRQAIDAAEAGVQSGQGQSKDDTLHYRWDHLANGTRRIMVEYIHDGVWQEALAFSLPAANG
jgi:hypothetical protein